MKSTPVKLSTMDGVLRYSDISGREEDQSLMELVAMEEPLKALNPSWSMKYVDDLTVAQHHHLPAAVSTYSTNKIKKEIHANECKEIFETIKENASRIGMKVNHAKTQLLCMSSYDTTSLISSGDNQIDSQNTMKILGYVLDNRGGAVAHISDLYKRVGRRSWTLIHLRRAGVEKEKLVIIYTSLIRPIIEYALQMYHHLLSNEQSEKIESLQRNALKIILRPWVSYREALQRTGIRRLSDRRTDICVKFAKKTLANPRYAHWFPQTPTPSTTYEEETVSLKKLPRLTG